MNEDLHVWEDVINDPMKVEVRRLRVPAGWLYQVAMAWHHDSGNITRWSEPVFVPDASPQIYVRPVGSGG